MSSQQRLKSFREAERPKKLTGPKRRFPLDHTYTQASQPTDLYTRPAEQSAHLSDVVEIAAALCVGSSRVRIRIVKIRDHFGDGALIIGRSFVGNRPDHRVPSSLPPYLLALRSARAHKSRGRRCFFPFCSSDRFRPCSLSRRLCFDLSSRRGDQSSYCICLCLDNLCQRAYRFLLPHHHSCRRNVERGTAHRCSKGRGMEDAIRREEGGGGERPKKTRLISKERELKYERDGGSRSILRNEMDDAIHEK